MEMNLDINLIEQSCKDIKEGMKEGYSFEDCLCEVITNNGLTKNEWLTIEEKFYNGDWYNVQ